MRQRICSFPDLSTLTKPILLYTYKVFSFFLLTEAIPKRREATREATCEATREASPPPPTPHVKAVGAGTRSAACRALLRRCKVGCWRGEEDARRSLSNSPPPLTPSIGAFLHYTAGAVRCLPARGQAFGRRAPGPTSRCPPPCHNPWPPCPDLTNRGEAWHSMPS